MNRRCPCGHKFVNRDKFAVKDGVLYCMSHFLPETEQETRLNKLMDEMDRSG